MFEPSVIMSPQALCVIILVSRLRLLPATVCVFLRLDFHNIRVLDAKRTLTFRNVFLAENQRFEASDRDSGLLNAIRGLLEQGKEEGWNRSG